MKDLTKNEKYCIKWFEKRGYNIEVKKQWNSKTVFHVVGNGIDFEYELMQGIEDIKKYMKITEVQLELIEKINKCFFGCIFINVF